MDECKPLPGTRVGPVAAARTAQAAPASAGRVKHAQRHKREVSFVNTLKGSFELTRLQRAYNQSLRPRAHQQLNLGRLEAFWIWGRRCDGQFNHTTGSGTRSPGECERVVGWGPEHSSEREVTQYIGRFARTRPSTLRPRAQFSCSFFFVTATISGAGRGTVEFTVGRLQATETLPARASRSPLTPSGGRADRRPPCQCGCEEDGPKIGSILRRSGGGV